MAYTSSYLLGKNITRGNNCLRARYRCPPFGGKIFMGWIRGQNIPPELIIIFFFVRYLSDRILWPFALSIGVPSTCPLISAVKLSVAFSSSVFSVFLFFFFFALPQFQLHAVLFFNPFASIPPPLFRSARNGGGGGVFFNFFLFSSRRENRIQTQPMKSVTEKWKTEKSTKAKNNQLYL